MCSCLHCPIQLPYGNSRHDSPDMLFAVGQYPGGEKSWTDLLRTLNYLERRRFAAIHIIRHQSPCSLDAFQYRMSPCLDSQCTSEFRSNCVTMGFVQAIGPPATKSYAYHSCALNSHDELNLQRGRRRIHSQIAA